MYYQEYNPVSLECTYSSTILVAHNQQGIKTKVTWFIRPRNVIQDQYNWKTKYSAYNHLKHSQLREKKPLISARRVIKLTAPRSTGSDHPEENLRKYTSISDKYVFKNHGFICLCNRRHRSPGSDSGGAPYKAITALDWICYLLDEGQSVWRLDHFIQQFIHIILCHCINVVKVHSE